jgi:hypothetical protein
MKDTIEATIDRIFDFLENDEHHHVYIRGTYSREKLRQIIQAAIDKAYDEGHNAGLSEAFELWRRQEDKAAQPQRSEQVYADSCYEAEKGIRLPASNIYGAASSERCGAYIEYGAGIDGKGCGKPKGHEGNHGDK